MSSTASPSASTGTGARAGAHPLRPISFGTPAITVDRRDDGTIYLRPKARLHDYPVRLTDRLHHWAETAPDRIFMAERNAARGWRQITYRELLTSSRHSIVSECDTHKRDAAQSYFLEDEDLERVAARLARDAADAQHAGARAARARLAHRRWRKNA